MKPTYRTLVAFGLFTVLFFGAVGSVVTLTSAQTAPGRVERIPVGNDKLFTPLPDDGLYEGKQPARSYKTLLLAVPNPDSPHDLPQFDLTGNRRASAVGFMLTLEQYVDYLPQLYQEDSRPLLRRYQPRLRAADVPRLALPPEPSEDGESRPAPTASDFIGRNSVTLDRALADWRADIVIAWHFLPGTASRGLVYRYAGGRVERAAEFTLGGLSGSTRVTEYEAAVRHVCQDIGADVDREGNSVYVAHAPVPPIAASDRALATFARMRMAFEIGELTDALLEYLDFLSQDKANGRVGLYGIEIYRALAAAQVDPAENLRYNELAVEHGRRSLQHAPNDVYLRGLLCWHAATHMNRFLFAQDGLRQAMRIQPGNAGLFKWWITVYEIEDRAKQVAWLKSVALPMIRDGRVELMIADTLFGSGDYAGGVEWYRKGLEHAPDDFELNLGLGMCATHEAERLVRARERDAAAEMYELAVEALTRCQNVQPCELMSVYDYYVRAATHSFTLLPTNTAALDRLFLTQACLNGLESASNTFRWDPLVKDVINVQRRIVREDAMATKPGDDLYEMRLISRLRFQAIDGDNDGMIHTLWVMYHSGMRPRLYEDLMQRLAPIVHVYKP